MKFKEGQIISQYNIEQRYIIRIAQEEDLPNLEWFGSLKKFRKLIRATFEEQKESKKLMLVAEINNFPVAQLWLHLDEHQHKELADGKTRALFYALRTLEPFQGRGIGSKLLQEAEKIAAQFGFKYVTIGVAKENGRALKLYLQQGFKIFKELTDRWSYEDKGKIHWVTEEVYALEKSILD